MVREGKQSFSKVARDLDLMETSVREWVQQAAVDTGQEPSDALTTAERAEIEQLQRDVKRLNSPGWRIYVKPRCRAIRLAPRFRDFEVTAKLQAST